MGVTVVAVVVASALLALAIYANRQRLSPDGKIYLAAARGERVPRPFHLRPLLPLVLGERIAFWRVASFVGLVAAAAGICGIALAAGLDAKRAVFAAALFAALPIARSTIELPVLVDGPALALTAASAMLAASGHGVASALVALVGAAVKEHVPVFAAAAAWSLWPLLGLLVPAALFLLVTPAAATDPSQSRPFSYAREKQAPRLLSIEHSLSPWGVCVVALLVPSWPLGVSLALSYGMLFVASDSTRIYQWAAIPVCVAAAMAIPDWLMVPAIAFHVLNPWQGAV